MILYHRRTLVPPYVNGDIGIQCEWSQKPNPLTDYDKTVHIYETNT